MYNNFLDAMLSAGKTSSLRIPPPPTYWSKVKVILVS